MLLRPAMPADLPLLWRWEKAPHVLAASGDPDFNDWDRENQLGRTVPWREMLIAEMLARGQERHDLPGRQL